MKPKESKKSQKSFMKSSSSANLNKISWNKEGMKSKMIRKSLMSNTLCSRLHCNQLRVNHKEWILKSLMLTRKCKSLKSLSCNFILKQRLSEMISSIMLLNKRLSRKVQPIFSNKLNNHTKLYQRKRLKLKTFQMKFLE